MKQLLRKLALGFALVPLLTLASSGIASAHELEEDNGISGVLHIPPEDNPQAGQPTELDESFSDAKNVFSLADCNCKIVVAGNGKTPQTVILNPALPDATLASVTTVNFPSVGVYSVLVEGSAKDGAFPNFSLDYEVRVPTVAGGAPQTNGQGQEVVLIGLGNLTILIVIGVVAVRGGRRYSKKH